MRYALLVFIALTIAEGGLWSPSLWPWRRALSLALALPLALVSGSLVGLYPTAWTGALAFLTMYRLINLLRVSHDQTEPRRLWNASRSAWCWLPGIQIVLAAGGLLQARWQLPGQIYLYGLGIVQLAAALLLVWATRRNLIKTLPPAQLNPLTTKELPTVSVLIPARNETEDLIACLDALVASTYPKLEILVLDDCSQERRTPEIIRGYAHDGVRFIAGSVPGTSWLAKNYAYQQLAEAANGDLLLFCGVDTRFAPEAIQRLVLTLRTKNKQMLSILPRNDVPSSKAWDVLLCQPGRYAWELALPRRWWQRPPVLSTAWLISRQQLAAAGGLKAVKRSVIPERYFAAYTARHHDGYSFLQATEQLNIQSAKSLAEQRATAVRTRYPALHQRLELAAFVSLAELLILLLPFGLAIAAVLLQLWGLLVIALLTVGLLLYFYIKIVSVTYRRFIPAALWQLPLAAVYDLGLLNYSMWQYEFNEVLWKGRNVCIPVLQAIPRLPKVN